MSYSITEAERKHVATIEDTSFRIERVGTAEDTTPQYNLHMTDGDKLDLNIELPKLRFECNNEDDRHSRIRVIASDSVGEDHEIILDGLTGRSGNPLGLGWRFKVTFGTDDDGFINKMIVERKNDGKVWTNDINAFSDLIIKNLVIGSDDVEGSGNLEVKGQTTLDDSLVAKDADFNGVEIGKEDVAIKSNGKESILDKTTITEVNVTDVNVADGTTNVSNQEINLSNTHIVGDEGTEVELSHLDATHFHSDDFSVESLESNRTVSHDTVLDGITFVHDSFTADNLNVNERIDTQDLRVTQQFEANKAALNDAVVNHKAIINEETVETARITTENVGTSTINEATINDLHALNADIDNLEVNTFKTNRLEANSIDVDSIDMEEAEIGKIRTNEIRSLDDQDNLISDINDQIQIGDGNKELILNSAPSGNPNDRTYERIKVICGDNVAHLATLEDLREENYNGVVDLTTNQTIGGVKRFKNHIIADVGLVGPDSFDQDKVVNLITRMWDPNDPDVDFATNPEWTAAKAMADEYDEYLAKYTNASKKYTAAIRAKHSLDSCEASLNSATTRLESSRSQLEDINASIEEITTRLDTARSNKARDISARDDKIAEVSVLGGSANLQRTKAAHIEALEELDRLNALLTTVANGEGAVSVLFSNPRLINLKDESVSIDTKISTLRNFLSDYSEETWAASYEAVDTEISNIYRDTFTVSETPRVITSTRSFVNVYDFLKNYANAWSPEYDESKLVRCLELEASINNLTAAIDGYNENIIADTALLESKNSNKNTLEQEIRTLETQVNVFENDRTEKLDNFNSKWSEYSTAYEEYTGETLEQDELIEPATPDTMVPSYNEQQYKRYKLGLINENIPTTEHDKITVVGNREDELQFESDSLEDGDEHIQATIGGHYHKLANLDDAINANFAAGTNNKIIGDADINALDDNKIEFKVTKNKVKTASYAVPENLGDLNQSATDDPATTLINNDPESSIEKIFTLKGSTSIKITKENNDENIGVIDFDEEAFENKLRGRDSTFIVSKIENVNGTKVEEKYPDGSVQDTIKFKSDRQHLIFEDELDEKTTNIDINVYEPDIDLGEETLQGYVNAYERLDAVRQNLDLIPNAIAVKSLHSDSGKKIQKVQHELDTRVPPSPKIKGRYGLVATVSSNDQGGVSSIYSWDGTITGLPDVYEIHDETFITNTYITQIQQFFNEETGQVEEREVRVPVTFAEDWNGNPIEYYDQNHPVEYIPKMRVYAVTTDDGKRRITPVIKWVPMDYNGQTINPDTTQEQGHDSYSDITNDNTYYDGITENDFSIGD